MASFVRLDLFPASATLDTGEIYTPARVIVTDDAVHVYMDASGGPAEVYTARLDDFSGRRTTGYTAVSDGGVVVTIARASGCGCGSRLKGFRPFAGVPQVSTP